MHPCRSSSSSQRSSNTPGRSVRAPARVTTRRSREPSYSISTPSRRSRDAHNSSNADKVYNSKDYEDDNPFAASDEVLTTFNWLHFGKVSSYLV